MSLEAFMAGFVVFGLDALLLTFLVKQAWSYGDRYGDRTQNTEGAPEAAGGWLSGGWRTVFFVLLALGKCVFLLAGILACLQLAKLAPPVFAAGAVVALSFFVAGVFTVQARRKPVSCIEENAVLCGAAGVKSGLEYSSRDEGS